jgi:hypothetical protein
MNINEHVYKRRVREEFLAAATADDESVASRHWRRAERFAGRARKLAADAVAEMVQPRRAILTLRKRD